MERAAPDRRRFAPRRKSAQSPQCLSLAANGRSAGAGRTAWFDPRRRRQFVARSTADSLCCGGVTQAVDGGFLHARFRSSDRKIGPLSNPVQRDDQQAERRLLKFGPMIKRQREVFHEKAFGRASRNRDSFGGHAGVRARRLRSERPSRLGGPMRLGRSKSSLVSETHGPCRRSRPQWDVVVLSVRRQLRRRPAHGRRWTGAANRRRVSSPGETTNRPNVAC